MTAEKVAIIPARAASKGVPGKNKRVVNGKPLIVYTLEAAVAASSLDRVVVTTDDPEVAVISRAAGAEVVVRPSNIARDDSPVIEAVLHALEALGIADLKALVLLQPTTPLRTVQDIDAALALFERRGLPVCSVCKVDDAHPARMYRLDDEIMHSLMPEAAGMRRQDLPPLVLRNGAIYIVGPEQLRAGRIINDPMAGYEMPPERSVNIDSELDLLVLEALLGSVR